MWKPDRYNSLREMIMTLIPEYRGKSWRPFCVTFPWNKKDADFIWTVSRKRCSNRIASYVDEAELDRSKESIRFGVSKTGRGYKATRGDFCLIAGSLSAGHLWLFYRRIELLGGLHFDLAVIDAVEEIKGPIKRISIFSVEAAIYALKGNSNEKLYAQLRKYYGMDNVNQ